MSATAVMRVHPNIESRGKMSKAGMPSLIPIPLRNPVASLLRSAPKHIEKPAVVIIDRFVGLKQSKDTGRTLQKSTKECDKPRIALSSLHEVGPTENQPRIKGDQKFLVKSCIDSIHTTFIREDSTSQSTPSSRDGARRRAIFGNYWKRDDTTPTSCANLKGNIGTQKPPDEIDIRAFSAPRGHSGFLGHNFSRIDDFPQGTSPVDNSFPPIPTPLRRYIDSPITGGVYPLVSPRSILRRSSYEPSEGTENCAVVIPTIVNPAKNNVEVTEKLKSIRKIPMIVPASPMKPLKKSSPVLLDQKSSTSKERHRVKLDPRITVSEYDDTEQIWFTKEELTSFKYEAIRLAQMYLATNPEVAQHFRRGRVDPMTGKVRQRAIYTNPVFSLPEDNSFLEDDSKDIRRTIETEIKTVLIVDPNKAILNLMCKSIQQIFPDARIAALQNGEDASQVVMTGLSQYCQSKDANKSFSFDLIIVEERLFHRKQRTGLDEMLTSPQSSSLLQSRIISLPDLTEDEHDCQVMSGSQLLRRVVELGTRYGTRSSVSFQADTSSSDMSSYERVPLLIGVSLNLDEDAAKLKEGGADVLWSKPPPPFDLKLRNSLLRSLMSKRTSASALGSLQSSSFTKSLRTV